ncbi:hypothetical protein [Actinoplanes sp. N902-109]|uniref:hypothetical protein n=1 Tax=Actinoplanes sp. (strain N902-109) TaxID=649831 RepID=UPI0003295F63|nr:hypothetical protein [Actinoplanes sp. N902-109]AGL19373.1 hypothetical protein L083_5863 [Actinoplanes sp. N902-109]
MSVDLIATVKLLHKVFEFLAQQTSADLADLVSGRSRLAMTTEAAEVAQPAAPSLPQEAPAAPSGPPTSVAPKKPAARRRTPAKLSDTSPADAVFPGIAAKLREQESVNEGARYLDGIRVNGRKLTKNHLIAIGQEMGLTLPRSGNNPDRIKKLVEHATGARRRYAGLGSW